MPFTLAHAVAVIPMRRLNLIWSAVVVGCFAPDIEYFLRIPDEYRASHGFPGIITFTLPLALVSLYVFHRLLKHPFLELAPDGMRSRLAPYSGAFAFTGFRRFSAIVACVSIGIATHIVWDAFTHPHTWAYHRWMWLQGSTVVSIMGKQVAFANCEGLQNLSSALGCIGLGLWLTYWYRSAEVYSTGQSPMFKPAMRHCLAIVMLLVPLCIGGVLALRHTYLIGHVPRLRTLGKYLIYIPGGLFLLEATCLALWAFGRTQRNSEPA